MLRPNENLGSLLRGFRHGAGLTLEELGEASGVSARAISDMERGYSRGPQARTVEAVADALALTGADRIALLSAAREGRRRAVENTAGLYDLPPGIPDFVGRAEQVGWLGEAAYPAQDQPSVFIVSGGPGLGKTTLAVHAARQVADAFPDGCHFLDLRGLDQEPVDPDHALFRLLKALGTRENAIPADPQERRVLYLRLLRDKRALIVLDNAADETQIRPLLPGPGHSTVWITSRRTLTGIEHCRRLTLDTLTPTDSAQMLTDIIGLRENQIEPTLVHELAHLCGHLPLALRIIANRLQSRPTQTTRTLTDKLHHQDHRLDRLTAGDLHIEAAFALSYDQLTPQARELFRRLSLVPGPDVTPTHGAILTHQPLHHVEHTMDELIELGLLNPTTNDRAAYHDLIRLYARKRLRMEEEPQDQTAVRAALYDWLLRTAVAAGRWFEPDAPGSADPGAGADPDLAGPGDRAAARRWLAEEGANWLAAYDDAAEQGRHELVLEVAESMHWYSDYSIHWGHWPRVFELACRAARAVGDQAMEARMLNYLAWAQHICLGQLTRALDSALAAAALAQAAGDLVQESWAWQYANQAERALARREGGPERLEDALAHAEKAAAGLAAVGDREGHPQAVISVAATLQALGRTPEALDILEGVVRMVDDPATAPAEHIATITRSTAVTYIAATLAQSGDWPAAEKAYRRALELAAETIPDQVASIRQGLGTALRELGRTAEAKEYLHTALELFVAANDEQRAAEARQALEELTGGS